MNTLVIWLTLTACTSLEPGVADTQEWKVFESREAAVASALPADPDNGVSVNCKTMVYQGRIIEVE